jgi:Tol biopolymer transport system component
VHPRALTVPLLTAALIAAGTGPAAAAPSGPLTLVSVSTAGESRSGGAASINANGRYVVFLSDASDLVPGDTNDITDVFVRDRWTGTTSRANLTSAEEQTPPAGDPGAGYSDSGSISADGRYVAFRSLAGNLAPGTTSGAGEIFVRDRRSGTTRLVSVSADGYPLGPDNHEPMISGNGRYVVFTHVEGDVADFYRYDLRTTTIQRVAAATGWSLIDLNGPRPRISADGRYVAFTSDAADGVENVFVHDFVSGATRRVTHGTEDSYTGAISADGRYVVFASADATLVPRDTNGVADVFVHDLRTRSTHRASVSSTGAQGNNMSYVWMTISGDGRHVGFGSAADNLVPGDTNGYLDVFVHDRQTARTVRMSEPNGGGEADGESFGPMISADGRHIAFTSTAPNLLGDDSRDTSGHAYVRPLR